MPTQTTLQSIGSALRRHYRTWLLPRIVELPDSEWDGAIRKASDIDFDFVERIGLIAGVTFVAYVLRFDAESAALSLPVKYAAQFMAAVPLLLIVVGPVYLRRMRRGLDIALSQGRGVQE